MGYEVFSKEVICTQYGIPQTRKRHVVLASKIGKISLISPTHEIPVTVKDTIGSLEQLRAGEKSNNDPLHVAANLSEINLKKNKAFKTRWYLAGLA